MRSITFLLFLITTIANCQDSLFQKNDWISDHWIEDKDTLILSSSESDHKIQNILSFTNDYNLTYLYRWRIIEIASPHGVSMEYKEDSTLKANYSSIVYHTRNDTLKLIFFNTYTPLTTNEVFNSGDQNIGNYFRRLGNSMIMNFKFKQEGEKIRLIRIH